MQQQPQGLEALLGSGLGDRINLSGYQSAEYQQLKNQFLLDKAAKQNISLVSGCMSFATPFLPLGFLATFFLLGKLDGMDKGPEELFKQSESLKAESARLAAAEALARKQAKDGKGSLTQDVLGMVAAHRTQSEPFLGGGRSHIWAEKKVMPSDRTRGDKKFFVSSESYRKKAEIRKQKMALEAVKEHECKEQNFSAVAEISSKLNMLDKFISKLSRRDK